MNPPKIETNNMMLRTEANEGQGFTDRNIPPKAEFPISKPRVDIQEIGQPNPNNTHMNMPPNIQPQNGIDCLNSFF